jgi:hypothetical protein
MSITSYSELQTAVENWTARTDLTDLIPDWITLAESDFNRKIRVRQMMVTQTTTPSSGQFSLPTDYLAHVNVTYTGSFNRNLQYVHPSQFAERYPDSPSDVPRIFTVMGTTDSVGVVKIMPTDADEVDFTYYQKITALSTSNTSNWLLSAHPDVYLFGTLVEACAYTKDYDQAAIWKTRRDALIEDITKLDQKTRGPSSISVPGVTP